MDFTIKFEKIVYLTLININQVHTRTFMEHYNSYNSNIFY